MICLSSAVQLSCPFFNSCVFFFLILHILLLANPKVAPASMWTAKNLQEFKETIKKDGPEGILKIGHGETVTVRVPTHPEGLESDLIINLQYVRY